MKKILAHTPIIFSGIFLIFPLTQYIARLLHYQFILYNHLITFGVVTALLCLATVAMLITNVSLNKFCRVGVYLLLPLSVIVSGVYFILYVDAVFLGIFTEFVIAFVCAIILFMKYSKTLVIKIVFGVISGLIIFVMYFASVMMEWRNFGSETLVQSHLSPNNVYIAEVIAYNDGALGGDTVVQVKESVERGNINILIGELSMFSTNTVYFGAWDAYKDLKMEWKDESTLIINGDEYSITE